MKSLKYAICITSLVFVLLPAGAVVMAQLPPTPPGDGGGLPPTPPPRGSDDVPKIDNPLKCANCDNLSGFIIAVVEEAAKIGFYIVVFFIIYSGFLFVAAVGNEDKLKKARTTFLYTIIGAAILLGAVVLANVVKGTVEQLGAAQEVKDAAFIG